MIITSDLNVAVHHQQEQILAVMTECCILTQVTHFLRPVGPVCPDLGWNAAPHLIASGESGNPVFCPGTGNSPSMPPKHPDSNLTTIGHQD